MLNVGLMLQITKEIIYIKIFFGRLKVRARVPRNTGSYTIADDCTCVFSDSSVLALKITFKTNLITCLRL